MASSNNRGGDRGAEMWGIGGRRETMSGSEAGIGTGEAGIGIGGAGIGEAGIGSGAGEAGIARHAAAAPTVTEIRPPEAAPQSATSMREKRRNQPI